MITDLNVKYYYLVNDDLHMSKGKIASQVSHVAMMMGDKYKTIGKAIILKVPESNLKILKDLIQESFFIEDAGLTEVPKGSLTCVGFNSINCTNFEDIQKYKLL
jgi:peptidyl-tRNA hydrolase